MAAYEYLSFRDKEWLLQERKKINRFLTWSFQNEEKMENSDLFIHEWMLQW